MDGYGDGNGNGSDDHTPNELPDATLPVNRQYVEAMRGSLVTLAEMTRTLTALVHKTRMTREEVGRDLGDEIRDAYAAIEAVGRAGKAVVSKARGLE